MMGRPRIDGTDKKAQSVHLTAEHIATAKRLGDGNVSAGVRAALTHAATLSGPGRDRDQRDQTKKHQ